MHTTDRLAARRRRLAAAGIVGVVSVWIAAAGHALAGGGTPSTVALVLALVMSGVIGIAVVGTRLTRGRVLAGVVLDQLAFHALFSFFGPAAATVESGSSAHGAHAAHDGVTSGVLGLATGNASAVASSTAMIVAHLTAAALAYAMLRRGMTAVDAILAALATALVRLLSAALVVIGMPAPRQVVAVGIAPLARDPALLRLPDRRGPPVLAAR